MAAGIGFTALSNGFASCDDPAALQAICDRFSRGRCRCGSSGGWPGSRQGGVGAGVGDEPGGLPVVAADQPLKGPDRETVP